MLARLKKILPILESFFLISFFLFSVVFFLFHVFYARRVIPRIFLVDGLSLSNRTQSETLTLLTEKLDSLSDRTSVFDFSGKRFSFTPQSFGLTFEATATARKVYNQGRSGLLTADLLTEFRALIFGIKLDPEYSRDEVIWQKKVEEIFNEITGQPARYFYDKGLQIEKEKDGFKVERQDLEKFLLTSFLSLKDPIRFDLTVLIPELSQGDLEKWFTRTDLIIKKRPTLVSSSKEIKIEENKFLSLLTISREASPAVAREHLRDFVKEISWEINHPPKTLSFSIEGTKVVKLSPAKEGVEVLEEELQGSLEREIPLDRSAVLSIPVRVIKPTVASNDYGIKELIGEGKSNFAGSIPGRIKNIKRASAILNGVLVEPGGVFSYNNSLGEVSSENGYDYAYIIKEGRTVLGPGGGVCQVSSTVFRAALNSGLPILKRAAHAYRVHYYEQGSPPGLDATVYAPSVDLQFKNDTPSYILITSEIDGFDLTFRFFGSSDGRQAKFLGPTVLSSSPAPPAIYEDDPSLPKGVLKQIDWAASGAQVVFERTVERDGQIINRDKYTSNYKPWRAVYLVGTKE